MKVFQQKFGLSRRALFFVEALRFVSAPSNQAAALSVLSPLALWYFLH